MACFSVCMCGGVSTLLPTAGDRGGVRLGEALFIHPTLEVLDLRGNQLGDDGALASLLSLALHDMHSMRPPQLQFLSQTVLAGPLL